MQVISVNQYASGLSRLVAYIIDHILLSAVFSMLVWRWWWWTPVIWQGGDFDFSFHVWRYHLFYGLVVLAYYALMESSPYQATLGKIALGIKVVDQNNQRISFARALLRNLSKYLSALILGIGYIMIIFDERKQGLHDKIADTFIIRA
jgi:uncharacterized RDD family membrane protein YckC